MGPAARVVPGFAIVVARPENSCDFFSIGGNVEGSLLPTKNSVNGLIGVWSDFGGEEP